MKKFSFNVIRSVGVLDDTRIVAQFDNGKVKTYDIRKTAEQIKAFRQLIDDKKLFCKVKVDMGGFGLIWSPELDLSSEEVWNNGVFIHSEFENFMSFADAANIYGLEESALRKAVSYGKLIPGIDCCKFGKQWVVTKAAMDREYRENLMAVAESKSGFCFGGNQ